MAFAIATNVPKPVASISFNAVNIKTVALLPVASIGINITPVFRIKAEAQLPVGAILFNDTFKIKASALLPDASLSFNSSTVFSIAAKSKLPVASILLGSALVIHAKATLPVASLIFVGNSPPFNIAARAKIPVANIIFGHGDIATYTVMVMNLKNKLVSFYQNYNFESVGIFNGVPIGCDPASGLYLLSGADDNGTDIAASILLGDYAFGINNIKTNPEFFVNYSGNGEVQVSATIDQEDDTNGPYEVPAPHETKVQTRRAIIDQGLRGSHWQYLIENIQGSQVTIQNIGLNFKKSQRSLH
jgi:hypothetical protein